MSPPRTPARLQLPIETETEFGGRTTEWTDAGLIWIDLGPVGRRSEVVADSPQLNVQSATAVARSDPRLTRGVRLQVGDDPPWTVLAVDPDQPRPGRITLRLER